MVTDANREQVLAWAEKAGFENAKLHYEGSDILAKESATTLTILLAGAGGALAYAAKALEGPSGGAIAFAASAVSVWLFLCAAVLVQQCLRIRNMPPIVNEPINLFQPDYELNKLRAVELRNLQERIGLMQKRNRKTARWLNRVRLGAIATPLVGFIAWRFI